MIVFHLFRFFSIENIITSINNIILEQKNTNKCCVSSVQNYNLESKMFTNRKDYDDDEDGDSGGGGSDGGDDDECPVMNHFHHHHHRHKNQNRRKSSKKFQNQKEKIIAMINYCCCGLCGLCSRAKKTTITFDKCHQQFQQQKDCSFLGKKFCDNKMSDVHFSVDEEDHNEDHSNSDLDDRSVQRWHREESDYLSSLSTMSTNQLTINSSYIINLLDLKLDGWDFRSIKSLIFCERKESESLYHRNRHRSSDVVPYFSILVLSFIFSSYPPSSIKIKLKSLLINEDFKHRQKHLDYDRQQLHQEIVPKNRPKSSVTNSKISTNARSINQNNHFESINNIYFTRNQCFRNRNKSSIVRKILLRFMIVFTLIIALITRISTQTHRFSSMRTRSIVPSTPSSITRSDQILCQRFFSSSQLKIALKNIIIADPMDEFDDSKPIHHHNHLDDSITRIHNCYSQLFKVSLEPNHIEQYQYHRLKKKIFSDRLIDETIPTPSLLLKNVNRCDCCWFLSHPNRFICINLSNENRSNKSDESLVGYHRKHFHQRSKRSVRERNKNASISLQEKMKKSLVTSSRTTPTIPSKKIIAMRKTFSMTNRSLPTNKSSYFRDHHQLYRTHPHNSLYHHHQHHNHNRDERTKQNRHSLRALKIVENRETSKQREDRHQKLRILNRKSIISKIPLFHDGIVRQSTYDQQQHRKKNKVKRSDNTNHKNHHNDSDKNNNNESNELIDDDIYGVGGGGPIRRSSPPYADDFDALQTARLYHFDESERISSENKWKQNQFQYDQQQQQHQKENQNEKRATMGSFRSLSFDQNEKKFVKKLNDSISDVVDSRQKKIIDENNGKSLGKINFNLDDDENHSDNDDSHPNPYPDSDHHHHHHHHLLQHQHDKYEELKRKPEREKFQYVNITSQAGHQAYIPCHIDSIGDKMVSWIRLKDFHLLTIGTLTYIQDDRFAVRNDHTALGGRISHQSKDWILLIKHVTIKDEGLYECQINSDPPKSQYFYLHIVVPIAEIVGGPNIFVRLGEPINLTCLITSSPEPPSFVFWYHNHRMINYDYQNSDQGQIHLQKSLDRSDTIFSRLMITKAKLDHSGNYTCSPSNAESTHTYVHVLQGEKRLSNDLQNDWDHQQQQQQAHHHQTSAASDWNNRFAIKLISFLCTIWIASK
ncbi:Serine-tRNA ligase [Sarcoptes scabiei]|nr:Serine-tRNA ligase [Sarcoptes scabiei]